MSRRQRSILVALGALTAIPTALVLVVRWAAWLAGVTVDPSGMLFVVVVGVMVGACVAAMLGAEIEAGR